MNIYLIFFNSRNSQDFIFSWNSVTMSFLSGKKRRITIFSENKLRIINNYIEMATKNNKGFIDNIHFNTHANSCEFETLSLAEKAINF